MSYCPSLYDIKCTVVKCIFPGSPFGTGEGLQNIDGYYYYPSFITPPDRIALARSTEWDEHDVFVATYPKSGTHLMLLLQHLIVNKGALPEKTDLHTLGYNAEFKPGPTGDHGIPIEERAVHKGPLPRVVLSHMPM